jgi:hypothetical protein
MRCAQNPGLGHEKGLLNIKNPFKDVLSGEMDFLNRKYGEWRRKCAGRQSWPTAKMLGELMRSRHAKYC